MFSKDATQAPRVRGRPRSAELRKRILDAGARVVSETGADVGFEAIAQAAGASRTTLYRWWSSPEELLLDALLDSVQSSIAIAPDMPVLMQLRTHLDSAAAILTDPLTWAPLRALAAAALSKDAAHAAFYEHWLAPRRAAARTLIERGISDGTIIPANPDVHIDVLFAPLYHRALFTNGAISDNLVDELLRIIATHQP
ncbi:TetR/AcrR family transcriptional regulator [Herbiconiux moechotypicola]|uniref:TetR/AcrR family transcriptional regulator n=1 Tax=Herbiconiux moechotypicola TaxID=637393 RepID=UPI00217CCF42|nr:TetR/AcrR family transcriptional regulator [Herbiconiux moechotypicola]MCS5732005.1 TetR/AcrR family transcriptional regulator [Herbiconiux moechotypicola]